MSEIVSAAFAEHQADLGKVELDASLRNFSRQDTASLVIDGPSFISMITALGLNPDFGTLFREIRNRVRLRAIYYFAGVSDDSHHTTTREQLAWLRHNGVRVITKQSVRHVGESGDTRWKGNMDVDITVTVLTECDKVDTVILVTGDGDFVPLMRAVQRNGQTAVLLSTEKTEHRSLSPELRCSVDAFIELGHFMGLMSARQKPTQEPSDAT